MKRNDELNAKTFGPKYPPGEWVFIEKLGWARVSMVFWKETEWVYRVTKEGKVQEVPECQITL